MKLSHIIAGGAVLGIAGLALPAGSASAHTPNVNDTCEGLKVNLNSYEGGASNNTVTITVDGVSNSYSFGSSFSKTVGWADTENHTWSVVVDANLQNGNPTQYDWSDSGAKDACNPSTPSTTTTTLPDVPTPIPATPVAPDVTPPTCTTPGTVSTPVTEGLTYTHVINGDASVTVHVTADEGYVLDGPAEFGPYEVDRRAGDECVTPTTPVADIDTPPVPSTEAPTPVRPVCPEGKSLAEDYTCVPNNYWDVPAPAFTPAAPELSSELPATGNRGAALTAILAVSFGGLGVALLWFARR